MRIDGDSVKIARGEIREREEKAAAVIELVEVEGDEEEGFGVVVAGVPGMEFLVRREGREPAGEFRAVVIEVELIDPALGEGHQPIGLGGGACGKGRCLGVGGRFAVAVEDQVEGRFWLVG